MSAAPVTLVILMTEPIDLTEDTEPSAYVAPSRKRVHSRSTISALAEGLNERLHVAEASSGPRAVKRRRVTAVGGVDLPGPAPEARQQPGTHGGDKSTPTQAAVTAAPTPEPAQVSHVGAGAPCWLELLMFCCFLLGAWL